MQIHFSDQRCRLRGVLNTAVHHYSEVFTDLLADGIDVAVRIGVLAGSYLVARRLASLRRVLGAGCWVRLSPI